MSVLATWVCYSGRYQAGFREDSSSLGPRLGGSKKAGRRDFYPPLLSGPAHSSSTSRGVNRHIVAVPPPLLLLLLGLSLQFHLGESMDGQASGAV